MNVSITNKIDIPRHLKKIDDPTFWKFTANEWWKLYNPYVPMDTGDLSKKVTFRPKEIEHYVDYATEMYDGTYLKFNKEKHQLATAKWDIAAIPQQQDKLIQSMQNYVNSGRLKL